MSGGFLERTEDVYGELLRRIESGDYAPGKKIPTGRALAKEFGVTHWRVHQVINELEDNGFVECRRSQGTFVRRNIRLDQVRREKSLGSKSVTIVVARDFFYVRMGYEDIIGQTERLLTEAGLSVNYEEMPKTTQGAASFLKEAVEESSKAIVIFPERAEWEALQRYAHLFDDYPGNVFFFNRGLGPNDCLPFNSIGVDMRQSGALAADWIVKQGFSDIAFCGTSNVDYYWLNERYAGFQRRLKASGLSHTLFTTTPTHKQLEPIVDFIRKAASPPILVVRADEGTRFYYEHLLALNFKPGEDFHMLGFGNLPAVRHYSMATVAWPLAEAAALLAKAIVDEGGACRHDHHSLKILLKPHIIDREPSRLSGKESAASGERK